MPARAAGPPAICTWRSGCVRIPQFTRKDNDIYAELPVTLGRSGARRQDRGADRGRPVSMTVPEGRQHRHPAARPRQGRAAAGGGGAATIT